MDGASGREIAPEGARQIGAIPHQQRLHHPALIRKVLQPAAQDLAARMALLHAPCHQRISPPVVHKRQPVGIHDGFIFRQREQPGTPGHVRPHQAAHSPTFAIARQTAMCRRTATNDDPQPVVHPPPLAVTVEPLHARHHHPPIRPPGAGRLRHRVFRGHRHKMQIFHRARHVCGQRQRATPARRQPGMGRHQAKRGHHQQPD